MVEDDNTSNQSPDADSGTDHAESDEPVPAPPTPDEHSGDEHPSEGLQIQGDVTDVREAYADVVPENYPVDISTQEVIEIELSLGGPDDIHVVIYFESPLRGTDERLAQLLTLGSISPEHLEELEDESILLTVQDGFYMPVIPEDPPRGTGKAIFGIFLGLVPSILIALVGIFQPGSGLINSNIFVLAWFLATFVVLPISIYIDALNLKSTTNWEGTPRNWTILSAIPAINVVVIPLYLIGRENAEPIV